MVLLFRNAAAVILIIFVALTITEGRNAAGSHPRGQPSRLVCNYLRFNIYFANGVRVFLAFTPGQIQEHITRQIQVMWLPQLM